MVGWRLLLFVALVVVVFGVVRPLVAVRAGRAAGGGTLVALSALALLTGVIADSVGVGALTGGLLIGLAAPRDNGLVDVARARLHRPVAAVGVPAYLAVTGLQTDLRALRPEHLGAVGLVVAAAVVGKWAVATAVGRLVGLPGRDAVAVGTMLACGGLMTLVVVNAGRDAGLLTSAMQATLVTTGVLSTVVTAPLMVRAAARCGIP